MVQGDGAKIKVQGHLSYTELKSSLGSIESLSLKGVCVCDNDIYCLLSEFYDVGDKLGALLNVQ